MIVKMTKYTLVLYHAAREEFLARLQELGVVDITTAGWEPDEEEHALLGEIERHRAAADKFATLVKQEGFELGTPYADGAEAFERYVQASSRMEALSAQIAKVRKEAEELQVWGDFSAEKIDRLADAGIELHFYSCYSGEFEHNLPQWAEQYTVEPIAEHNGTTYFVAVTSADQQQPAIDAQALKRPTATAAEKAAEIQALEEELKEWDTVMGRCAASADIIARHADYLKDRLQFSSVSHSGSEAVEGRLILMEGWAPEAKAAEVDAFLDSEHDLFYIKSKPTPEDDTPVLLHNNRFARLFQIIGDFYSLPKYGTMDLTPYFAPFYMLFFGFCIGDAGYGLVFLLIGLFMHIKKIKGMDMVSRLVMWLGGASVAFGLLVGSFFGISLSDMPLSGSYVTVMRFVNDNLFYISLVLGLVQIIFGLVLNVINTSRCFGFKYSFGTLGWLIILLGCIAAVLLPMAGVPAYSFSSVPFYVTLGVGGVLMLFLNNPKRNPLVNFGAGLWSTYNNITGLLGDVLSYVRLFALCLSGSALAIVFNDLASSLAPDIPVVKQIVAFIILAFGHGMNIFMSAIGAFVHPMRLTFVEFYKNAGFEAGQRAYTPFRKIEQSKQ